MQTNVFEQQFIESIKEPDQFFFETLETRTASPLPRQEVFVLCEVCKEPILESEFCCGRKSRS